LCQAAPRSVIYPKMLHCTCTFAYEIQEILLERVSS
jgi:hypothetical protein